MGLQTILQFLKSYYTSAILKCKKNKEKLWLYKSEEHSHYMQNLF